MNDTLSVAENNHEYAEAGESMLIKLSRALVYSLIFLFPLWFLPTTILPVILNKVFFAAIIGVVALMTVLAGFLQSGKSAFPRSWIIYSYALFLVGWLLSTIFSSNIHLSLAGFGNEQTTFVTFLLGGILLLLPPLVVRNRKDLFAMLKVLVLSFLVIVLFFFLRTIFNVNLPFDFASGRTFNTIGLWTALGVFFGFILSMLIPMIGYKASFFWRFTPAWFVIAMAVAFITNVVAVWVGVGLVAVVFLALSLAQRKRHSALFTSTLLIVLLSVLLILLNEPLRDSIVQKIGPPVEISPKLELTVGIVRASLSRAPILGSGPNTFGILWDRFKSPEYNTNNPFWNIRFSSAGQLYPTIVAEGGALNAVLFLFFVLIFIVVGLRSISRVEMRNDKDNFLLKSSFAGAFFLLFMWFIYTPNATLVLLTFLAIGLFLAALKTGGLLRMSTVEFFESTQLGFIASLGIILVLIAGVVGIYYETLRYMASVYYGSGVAILSSDDPALNEAKEKILKAVKLDRRQDRYWRTLAQIETEKVRREINNTERSQQERLTIVQGALAESFKFAGRAKEVNDADAVNWRASGQAYEIGIQVMGEVASKEALGRGYNGALERNPTNPSIHIDIARTHIKLADVMRMQGKSKEAIKAQMDLAIDHLKKAVEMKRDYARAHFMLAQLYAAQNMVDEAIQSAENTRLLAPNDVGVLFQLGLLYYQKGDYNTALGRLGRAVELNQNFSNARYFLGLTYDRTGNKKEALKQFRAIARLNPENLEVQNIVAALESGGSAFDVLAPEAGLKELDNPPVEETGEAENQ